MASTQMIDTLATHATNVNTVFAAEHAPRQRSMSMSMSMSMHIMLHSS